MAVTINGSTGISGVDGSAGTPALQGGDTNTGIVFGTDTVGVSTGGVQRTTVDSSGRLLVGVGSANANGGVLQLSGGITFPGTAVAATDVNTLDDYEEGTWTPALTGGTLTVNSNGATYTKIGNRVLLTMDVSVTSVSAGNIAITGVPFTVSGITISAVGGDQFDFTTALIGLHGYIDTTSIFFFYYTTGSNGIRLTNSNIRASTTIRCSFQYKI